MTKADKNGYTSLEDCVRKNNFIIASTVRSLASGGVTKDLEGNIVTIPMLLTRIMVASTRISEYYSKEGTKYDV